MATLTVYAAAGDGTLQSFNATYSTARAGSGVSLIGGSTLTVGQSTGFSVYQSGLPFDTSAVGASATVSAAVLETYLNSDDSTTDFILRARDYAFGTYTAADFVAGTNLASTGSLRASLDTNGIGATGQYKTWTDAAMAAAINKTGMTELVLYSSRQEGNNQPSTNEMVALRSADSTGTTTDPKLTITYTNAVNVDVALTPVVVALTPAAPTVAGNAAPSPAPVALTASPVAPTVLPGVGVVPAPVVVRLAPGKNLIANAGFETDTAGWAAAFGAPFSRVTTAAHSGVASVEVVGGAGNQGITTGYTIVVRPSTTYTLSAWVRDDAAGIVLQVDRATAAVTYIGTTILSNTNGSGQWRRISGTFTTDATCERLQAAVYKSAPAAKTFNVDDVDLIAGAAVAEPAASVATATAPSPAPVTVTTTPVAPAVAANAGATPPPVVVTTTPVGPAVGQAQIVEPAPVAVQLRAAHRYAEEVLDGLLGYWRLGEAAGTTAAAVVGTDGTYVGTVLPTLGQAGLLADDADTAVFFDGVDRATDQSVSVTMNVPGPSSAVTLAAWVNVASVGSRSVIEWGPRTVTPRYHWLYFTPSSPHVKAVYQYVGGGFARTIIFDHLFEIGALYMVAAAHDFAAQAVTLYVNGAAVQTVSLAAFGSPASPVVGDVLHIGSDRGIAVLMHGTIDEPRVYGRALTEEEVAYLYRVGTAPARVTTASTAAPTPDPVVLAATTVAPAVSATAGVTPAPVVLVLAVPTPFAGVLIPLSATFHARGNLFARLYQLGAGMPIEVEVWDAQFNPPRLIAVLEGAQEPAWVDVVNEAGAFSFRIPRHDPKAGERIIAPGNLVKFKLHGAHRFAGWIEQPVPTTTSTGGPSGELLAVAGPGAAAYVSRAIVAAPDRTHTAEVIAKVLRTYLLEAQAAGRNVLPLLTVGWSDTHDSTGVPWDDAADWSFAWGANLDEVWKAAIGMGIDFRMTPALVLEAYEAGIGSDRSSSVVFRDGAHLRADVTVPRNESQFVNVMYVKGAEGAIRTVYGDHSDPRRGRREGKVDFTATDAPAALDRVGRAAIAESAARAGAFVMPVHHGRDGQFEPYLNYDKGDTVGVRIPGLPLTTRLAAIEIVGTIGGDYDVTLHAGAVELDNVVRLKRLIDSSTAPLRISSI